MNLTLADQYYLKALNLYDYDMDQTVEYLNYALSYDPGHAEANCLMGKFYMDRLQRFDQAEEFLANSLATEPENIATCECFSMLLIKTKRYQEALKLIRYGSSLRGANVSEFLRLEALICELQKDFDQAKLLLQRAVEECFDSEYVDFLNREIRRVESKIKSKQPV